MSPVIFVLLLCFRAWKPSLGSSACLALCKHPEDISVSTGMILKFFRSAALGGCSLLFTQAVWLHCKPESSAGVSPCPSLQGKDQWEQNRREHSLARLCFRQPPGAGWLSVCPTHCSGKARWKTPHFKISPWLACSCLFLCWCCWRWERWNRPAMPYVWHRQCLCGRKRTFHGCCDNCRSFGNVWSR